MPAAATMPDPTAEATTDVAPDLAAVLEADTTAAETTTHRTLTGLPRTRPEGAGSYEPLDGVVFHLGEDGLALAVDDMRGLFLS